MTIKKLLAGLILLVAGSLFIAACSAKQPTTTAPTIDANSIYTQAAQTVQAGLAQTEVVQPTSAPATETVQPTNTIDANLAAAMTSTAQSILPPSGATATGQATVSTTKTPVILPTATTKLVINTTPKSNTGDKAVLVAQDPPDGATASQGDIITVRLTLKNTGTTTWKAGKYALVYYAGDKMGSPNDLQMTKDVPPNDTITMIFTLTAPSSGGNKKVIWVVRNADGVNFYSLWLELNIK